jgi:uncharacterized protein (TIGR00269 family)
MRCRKCGQKAAIHLHQHRLALCKDHFLEWLPNQTEHAINKYHLFSRDDRILVAVSGGKDSLSLWDILYKLGYQADGVYIDLGIDAGIGYSQKSCLLAEQFASERNLKLEVVDVKTSYKENIPEMTERTRRGQSKPCSICGLVKRYLMNKAAQDGGYSVLATAHNLDDEAAILMMNTLNWSMDLIGRQLPSLPEQPGFVRKVKPFCRTFEREAAAYALLKGIKYIYEECPYSTGSTQLYYKQILNQIEDKQPSVKLDFYLGYLRASQKGAFTLNTNEEDIPNDRFCENCGQPTKNEGFCSFCNLIKRNK